MRISPRVLFPVAILMGLASLLKGEPPATPAATTPASAPAVVRPTRQEARRQAELLHATIHATLQVVHHRYYREDEGLRLPAAVLKEVFAELETEQHVSLRWLAIDGQPMNAEHKAKGEFELAAAKALQAGQPEYSRTENGVFRRAAPITLGNACLKCHVPDRKSTAARTAGLIISLPVQGE